jgi:hypothetical protein
LTGTGLTDPELTDPGLTAGQGIEDPALTDTRDLARLLYAALTGYWPGQQSSGGSGPGLLPPAPETDGALCTPRQVSAGVPASIDAVTCQALFQRPSRHGPALSTPAMFADALASVAPPVPMMLPPAPDGRTTAGGYGRDPATNPYPAADTDRRSRHAGSSRPPRQRSTVTGAVISVVIVIVLAAIGVTVWSASRGSPSSASPSPGRSKPTSPAAAADLLLKPISANSFDPVSTDDPGGAHYVISNSPSMYWHTDYYIGNSVFGGLKKGTGLILDMGKEVRLSQVMIRFGTLCCTHVEIEIGNSNTPTASTLKTFTTLQSSTSAVNATTFNITKNTTGRYVLIWITDLPPEAGQTNQYQALIYNVVVHGSAPGQSG